MAQLAHTTLKRLAAVGLLAAFSLAATAVEIRFQNWDDPDAVPWKEIQRTMPAFPKDENLVEFYVGEALSAKYYIDLKSISPGMEDGVVRYTMVVKTAGGARNISHEGLRCSESELKIFATGRADGTWSENPKAEWKLMKRSSLNKQQSALANMYFCPNYLPIYSAEEGQNALKRGANPNAPGESK